MNQGIEDFVRERVTASIEAKRGLLEDAPLIAELARVIANAMQAGHKLLVCGNGGSAADAQHIAAELAGRFYIERPSLPALALTVNTSALTAIGNDYAYDQVFARQLQGIGGAGDVLIAISTSGNSANVIEAVRQARGMGIVTIGFSGGDGGKLSGVAEYCLCVPSKDVARIQESHILVGHILCEHVEAVLFGPKQA